MSSATLRRRLRIARRRLGGWVLELVGPASIGALARTWSVELVDREQRDAVFAGGACVLALWHGRLLLPLAAHAGGGFCVLVSPSDDGSLVARMLERHGQTVVRGSTNKSPARALRALARELARGRRIVLTPDGPRGPRHTVNLGAAWLAARCGVPILPLGLACDRAWHLSSWDRFTIPRPRARIAIVYGEPLRVAAEADDLELARQSEELRRRLLAAERRGALHLGIEAEP